MTKILLVVALLLGSVTTATAKCSDLFYEVSGQVLDREGEPMPGALVAVWWGKPGKPEGIVMRMTGKEGRFTVPLGFKTYSGRHLFGGDNCNARLQRLWIAANNDTHATDVREVVVALDRRVLVDPLRMTRQLLVEPLWPDQAID